MATDRLIERNGLTYTCSDLLEGRNLCIEDSCELVRIEQGQTCQDFVKWKWFSTIQLQSWNPYVFSAVFLLVFTDQGLPVR